MKLLRIHDPVKEKYVVSKPRLGNAVLVSCATNTVNELPPCCYVYALQKWVSPQKTGCHYIITFY